MLDNIFYTSRAICAYHNLNMNILSDMVKCGVAKPEGNHPERWVFNMLDYKRIEMASNYYHDMKLGPEAAVVALELRVDLAHIRSREKNQA